MDIFLIDRWWSNWESASSTFLGFWTGLVAQFLWAIYTVNFSHMVGVSVSAKELKDIVKYILEGEPGHGLKTPTISFDCSSLTSASSLP